MKNKIAIGLMACSCLLSMMATASLGTDWLASHAQPDGSIQNTAGTALAYDLQATAATLESWLHFDEASRPEWTNGLDFVDLNQLGLTEEVARLAMIQALNGTPDPLLINDLLARINPDGGMGQAIGYQSNVLDTALALRAFSLYDLGDEDAIPLLTYLVNMDNGDGSYALMPGYDSSPYISALVVLALEPYQQLSLDIINQIQSTNAYLIQKQDINGGWGETLVSAMAIQALVKTNHPYIDFYPSILQLRDSKQNSRHWDDDVFTTALALLAEDMTASFPDPSARGTVTGVVISSIDQQPLTGVSVVRDGISHTRTYTNSLGQYFLANINSGAHTLVFSSAGFTQGNLNFNIEDGDSLNLGTITMVKTPDSGIIKGTVFDGDSGNPFPSVIITVESGGNTYQMNTNTNGYYQLAIPAGPFDISASANQRTTVVASGVLALNQTIDFSPSLYRNGIGISETQITGYVIDANTSLPLAGVEMHITPPGAQFFSNESGEFLVEQLPTGSLQILLSYPGYQGITIDLVSGGGLIDLGEIALTPDNVATQSTLLGIVTKVGSTNPIQGVQVEILNTALEVLSDSTGAYLVEGIPNVNYEVLFSAPGYEPLQYTISGTSHGTTELNVQLEQLGSSPLQVLEFLPDRYEYVGAEEVELEAEIQNASFQLISTRLYLRVVNDEGRVINFYPFKEVPYGGSVLDASETLEPYERRTVMEFWNTRFQEPGDYRIELLAYDENSQNLLRTASTVITILPVKVVSGKVEFGPNVTQFDPLQEIEIKAELVNSGNSEIGQVDVIADIYLTDKKNTSEELTAETVDTFTDPLLRNVNMLRNDSQGNLVIYSRNNNQFSRFRPDETFEALFIKSNIFDFHVDSNDVIWTLNYLCQLQSYDMVGNNLQTFNLAITGCKDFEIMNDEENFYVVSQSSGIYNFNKNTQQLDLVIGNLLEDPEGMIKHSDGRLLIADGDSGTILSYENGQVSTWVSGLNNPHGLVEDLDGTVLVANYGSNEIVRIDAMGVVSIVNNSITTPYAIDLNPLGGYFVSAEMENRLYQLESNGLASVVYDSFINKPYLITSGINDDVFIFNSADRTIVRRESNGVVTSLTTTSANVSAMHVNPAGELIVAMSGHIHRVEINGTLTQISNASTGSVNHITDADVAGAYWYVRYDGIISLLDAAGNISDDAIFTPFTTVKAIRSNGLGEAYVLDAANVLTKIWESGSYSRIVGGIGTLNGLYVSPADEVYVAKSDRSILAIDNLGNQTTYMTVDNVAQKFAIDSNGDVFYTTRGTEVYKNDGVSEILFATLNFSATGDFSIDHLDRIWISHPSNNKISVVNSLGVVTEIDTVGVIRPNSITVIDGTDSAWVTSRDGYFKIDLSGQVTDINEVNEFSTVYGIEMAVLPNSYFLLQRGRMVQYNINGELIKNVGTFAGIRDLVKLNDDLFILTQTPNYSIIKYSSTTQLPDFLSSQTFYDLQPGVDADHLYATTSNDLVEIDLTNQSIQVVVAGAGGTSENVAVTDGLLHLTNSNENLYRIFDTSGNQQFNLYGLNNLQGIAVADDGFLYLTDDKSIFRFDGINMELLQTNIGGGYIHHANNTLFKVAGNYLNRLYLYDTVSNESDVRDIDSIYPLKHAVYENDQNIKLVSERGLIQYGFDGTETVLISSVSNITDILHREDGTVLLASSNPSVQGGILQLENDAITNFYSNEQLFGVVPTSLFEVDGTVYAYSESSVRNNLLKIGSQPRKILNPFALHSNRMVSVAEMGGYLYGTNGGSELIKSLEIDAAEAFPLIGDLVYSDSQSVDFSVGPQAISFANFQAPVAGEFAVTLRFSDTDINADINDNLFVGNVAEGIFELANVNIPPGNQTVNAHMLITGIDIEKTVNVIEKEAAEIMYYNGNTPGLANYVLVENNAIIYTDVNNTLVKKYDLGTGNSTTLFTNNTSVTDMKKDLTNTVFLVNSPERDQIQWIDNDGNTLQVKDLGALFNFGVIQYADVNSVGNMVVFARYNSEDYGLYEIDFNTDTIVDSWSSVPVETNMWITSNDNVYLLGTAITEINLQQNRAVQLREQINREVGESSRNGVAVCEDSVIYSDPIIGEEQELFTGAVRRDLIYNGDNPDLFSYIADFESLMYDKETSSLLIFDHLISIAGQPGRILKVPVTCGQMYVEVVARDRIDSQLVGFDVAPDQTIQVADDVLEYRWVIDDLDMVQQIFNFQVQVENLLPNESRPILDSAYIIFRSDLNQRQELTNPIPIPVVLGVPDRTVSVNLDQASYLAQTDVLISNTVNNTAAIEFNGSLVQFITDEQGNHVDTLGAVDVIALPATSQQVFDSNWNTANYFAGDYIMVTQLLDELGNLQDEQMTPFIIEVDENNVFAVEFNALTNQAQYHQNDTVEINATLTNVAANAVLTDTTLEVIVTAPDSSVLLQQTSPVNALVPNASQLWQDLVTLNQAEAGIYVITYHLKDAAESILESFVYNFEVVTDNQLSFLGQVSLEYTEIQPGTDNVCYFELTNESTQNLLGQEIELLVVNLSNQLTVQSTTQFIDLNAGATWQDDITVPTNSLSSGDHACLIRTVVATEAVTQASAVFSVTGANQLTGQIFDDFNGDGIIDANDSGIENVSLNLLDVDLNVIQTISTDATGFYQFNPIFNGQYTVVVDETGVLSTALITTSNNNIILNVENGNQNTDFGYQYSDSSLQGSIWNDINDDGVVDMDEDGFENVSVRLLDADLIEFAATATDANGLFEFNNITSGPYQLEITDEQQVLEDLRNTTDNEPLSLDVFSHNSLTGMNFGYRLDVFDLEVFTTNCKTGLYEGQLITYQVQVRNLGNTDILQASVENLVPVGLSNVNWSCTTEGGATCGGSGVDDVIDLIDIPQGATVNYLIEGTVSGQLLDIITDEVNVTMPNGINDDVIANNQAFDSDMVLDLYFLDGFECAAPSSPVKTQNKLLDLLVSKAQLQQGKLMSYMNQEIKGKQ